VNRDAPPEKGTGALPHAPRPLNPQLAQDNSGIAITQVWRRWYDEAERIARDYARTGNPKHLAAFCRHAIGILSEVERSLPR
jgi:hypothetical protein